MSEISPIDSHCQDHRVKKCTSLIKGSIVSIDYVLYNYDYKMLITLSVQAGVPRIYSCSVGMTRNNLHYCYCNHKRSEQHEVTPVTMLAIGMVPEGLGQNSIHAST